MNRLFDDAMSEVAITEEREKLSLVELKDRLIITVLEEKANTKLIGHINSKFIEKGLLYYVPQQIFDDKREIDDLNNIELICFTKAMFEYTKNKKLDPELYFTSTEMIAYDTWVEVVDDYPDYILYKEAIRISPRSFIVVQSSKLSSEMRERRQYIYFKPAQRPAKNVIVKGTPTSRINVNKEGVADLKDRIIENSIFPTQIAWAVLTYEGKKPQVSFTPMDKDHPNIGTLKIVPNWNSHDIDYTPFIINDGFHRLTAQANAYDEKLRETGEELDYNLSAVINIMTEEESKQYVLDSFKRNFADEGELGAMELTDENKFVENIVEKSTVLKNNVATTFKNIKIFNSLTSKDILSSAIKLTGFDIKDEIEVEIQSTKCAKIIDLIINRLCKEYYDNDINKMKESYLLQPNMFAGYIALADLLRNDSKYITKIVPIVEELYLQEEKNIDKLKLKNKDCSIKKVFNYFSNFVGVI